MSELFRFVSLRGPATIHSNIKDFIINVPKASSAATQQLSPTLDEIANKFSEKGFDLSAHEVLFDVLNFDKNSTIVRNPFEQYVEQLTNPKRLAEDTLSLLVNGASEAFVGIADKNSQPFQGYCRCR